MVWLSMRGRNQVKKERCSDEIAPQWGNVSGAKRKLTLARFAQLARLRCTAGTSAASTAPHVDLRSNRRGGLRLGT